jgi:hypothetical protein
MSDRLLTLRASSTPLAFLCAASVRAAEVPINETNDAAGVGTAAHAALRSLAENGRLDWDAIAGIAKSHGVNEDDVRNLCAQANKLWPQLAETFKDALTEVDLMADLGRGFMLTGHADLLSITGPVARGGDWKTGRKDGSHEHQLRAYCVLVLAENPELTEASFTAIWVREGEIENYTMDRAAADRWVEDLFARVVDWDGVYRPGNHCAHCPRSHECPAANALIRRDVAAIADRDLLGRVECELELMSPSEIVSVLGKADMVAKYAERVRGAIKKYVKTHGDIVGDGVRLTITTERRKEVNPLLAWPVLEEAGFTDDDLAHVIDIRPSRVDDRVAEKSERGKGASNVRAMQQALESAGAVTYREIEKLTSKRA